MPSISEATKIINKMPLSKFSDEELSAISICVKAAHVADFLSDERAQAFGNENTILAIHDFLKSRNMPDDVLPALGFEDAEEVIAKDEAEELNL